MIFLNQRLFIRGNKGSKCKVEILSGDALYKMDTQSGNVEIMKEKRTHTGEEKAFD